MERIIKFRCWNIANKSMHAWQDIADAKQDAVWFWLYLNANAENNILMQFTGLIDKNGVEIYEGDVVKMIEKYSKDKTEWVGEILWKDYTYAFKSGALTFHFMGTYKFGSVPDMVLEVIGNIHENNNLLTQQKQ